MRTHPALLLVVWLLLTACDDSTSPGTGSIHDPTGDDPTGPATGSIRVAASTGGTDLDPDGYAVRVDDSQSQAVGINASATFADVTVGDHDVELTGVAANCAITGANPRTLAVSAGSTATTTFQVTCAATRGGIAVTASTTGIHPDADGYIVTVDGGQERPIAANGTAVFTGLAPGDHEVELSGVGSHCALEGMNPRTLAVSVGSTASTTFQVTCAAAFEGRIAFVSSGDIYVMDADGAPVNLTKTGSGNLAPDWSPDGTRIAFASDRDHDAGQYDIFVMNADGSNPVNLTHTGSGNIDPAWSPDGTRIAFASGYDIFVMNADGSNPVNLTFMEGENRSRRGPAWSPDGTRIAFAYNVDIYVMDADGSHVVNLSDLILPNISEYIFAPIFGSPVWSPDGTRIAFSLSDDICCRDIYVVNADGSNPRNLTPRSPGRDDRSPAWSPDGRRIAHSRPDAPGGSFDIYVMDDDGTNLIRLTAGTGSELSPAWAR